MFSLLLFMSRVHSRGLGRQRPGSPHLRISTRATGRCVCVCVQESCDSAERSWYFSTVGFLSAERPFRIFSFWSGVWQRKQKSHKPRSLLPARLPAGPAGSSSSPFPVARHGLGPPRDGRLCPRGSLCAWVFLSPVRSAPRPLPDAARKRLHASSLDAAQRQCAWSGATSFPVGAPG